MSFLSKKEIQKPTDTATLLKEMYLQVHKGDFSTQDWGITVGFLLEQEALGVTFTQTALQELAEGKSEFDYQLTKLASPQSVEALRLDIQRDAQKALRRGESVNIVDLFKHRAITGFPQTAAPAISYLLDQGLIDRTEGQEILALSFEEEAKSWENVKQIEADSIALKLRIGNDDEKAGAQAWNDQKDRFANECRVLAGAIREDRRHFPRTATGIKSMYHA